MLGSTVPVRNGIHNCFIYADLWKCDCIQIYSTLSRRWNIPEKPSEESIVKFKDNFKKSTVNNVVSHIPFLVNLCSNNLELQKKSVNRLATELLYNNKYGIYYTVLHPGSNPNRKEAIKTIADNINKVIEQSGTDNKCNILLETMSGQGNYIGNFEDISNIIRLIDNKEKIGICLDTAHIFQNGYDINNCYEETIDILDKIIGINYIKVIHLNDSLTGLSSHIDRHAFIGEGHISINTLKTIVNDPIFINIPKILELPNIKRSSEALNILRS